MQVRIFECEVARIRETLSADNQPISLNSNELKQVLYSQFEFKLKSAFIC